MPYPLLASGTDVATEARAYIAAYKASVELILSREQVNAEVATSLTAVSAAIDADDAILATVTDDA